MDERVATLIQQGQQAAQRGNPDMAREYLRAAVDLEPTNTTALLWLASVVESPDEQRHVLERVLELEPGNSRAREGLADLDGRYGDPSPGAPSEWESPSALEPTNGGSARSIEEELRAALRTPEYIPDETVEELESAPAAAHPMQGLFRADTDDMPYRVAVAALLVLLALGVIVMLLLLLEVGPFVPRP